MASRSCNPPGLVKPLRTRLASMSPEQLSERFWYRPLLLSLVYDDFGPLCSVVSLQLSATPSKASLVRGVPGKDMGEALDISSTKGKWVRVAVSWVAASVSYRMMPTMRSNESFNCRKEEEVHCRFQSQAPGPHPSGRWLCYTCHPPELSHELVGGLSPQSPSEAL